MGLRTCKVNDANRLRQRVEVLVAEVSGHDRDRNWIIARGLTETRHQRPRTLLAGSSRQHQDRDVLIVLDDLEDFRGLLAVPDYALRRDARDAIGTRRKL